MYQIVEVLPLPGYRLAVTFSDGVSGEVDLSNRLFGPMFEPLKDQDFFSKASIDEFGAIFWPNNADLAPDTLYKNIKSSSIPENS